MLICVAMLSGINVMFHCAVTRLRKGSFETQQIRQQGESN